MKPDFVGIYLLWLIDLVTELFKDFCNMFEFLISIQWLMIPSQPGASVGTEKQLVQKMRILFKFKKIIIMSWWISAIISLRFIEIGWLDSDSKSRQIAWERSALWIHFCRNSKSWWSQKWCKCNICVCSLQGAKLRWPFLSQRAKSEPFSLVWSLTNALTLYFC